MSMHGDSRNDVRRVSYGNIGLQIGQKRGNMNEAQQAQQCHHNEFNINPYGAMQLMVDNGCELEGLGPHNDVERFRWCKIAGTFQIKVPDGWDPIGVAVILRRKFRVPEKRAPMIWRFKSQLATTSGRGRYFQVPDDVDCGVEFDIELKERISLVSEEKKPRDWTCNKFPAQATYGISGNRKGFAILIDCEDPPQYVSYVVTEAL